MKRRTKVIGRFPGETSCLSLCWAVLNQSTPNPEETAQPRLYYSFSLDQAVPSNHLVRRLAAAVDFSFVYGLVRRYYSHTGQPSVDPVVLFKPLCPRDRVALTRPSPIFDEIHRAGSRKRDASP